MASVPDDVFAKGALFGGPFTSTHLDRNTRSLLIDERWTVSYDGQDPPAVMRYAFATSTANYTDAGSYPNANLLAGFAELTNDQKAAVRTALGQISTFTNITFVEAPSPLAQDTSLRLARTGDPSSWGSFPAANPWPAAGDVFFASNGDVPAQYIGSDGFLTITHEIGHALGLKHGHETDDHGALDPDRNDNEFSVMTYASWPGSQVPPPTDAVDGSSPVTYMMYDIAALQAMYGANFDKLGLKETYRWSETTGQLTIDDRDAPFSGVTVSNKVFSTIWTQGAIATYDLSNFTQNRVDDLRPGQWLTFSTSQLAELNKDQPGVARYNAQGNVYNALLHDNDLRSAVANLITGSGNDTLIGNDRDNVLTANAGNDTLYTNGGNDTLSGGADADTFYFGAGHSVVRDTVADLDGDVMRDFGFSAVDILGERVGGDSLTITPGTTTVSVGGSTFRLESSFATGSGEFMISPRGSDVGEHTVVAFVNYLPSLAEGVRVETGSINGVANQPFLTGDGAVRFTAELTSAISAYANTLGYYKVAADGTISDVNILFGKTLGVAADATTVDLGTPGNNERIGFFLIQDGFDHYGSLPDDLSFRIPGTPVAASVDGFGAVLFSTSLGNLGTTPIFHSFANLNPSGAIQVLSGVAPGGVELQIGFEDLPSATGDNDFQDVVLGIWLNQGGNLFL